MIFIQRLFSSRSAALATGLCLGAVSLGSMAAEKLQRESLDANSRQVQVFVRLSTPAVSELNAVAIEATGAMVDDAAQRAQAARIEAEQAAFRKQLAGFGAQELSSLRVGANGIRMRVPASQIENLRSLPGVLSVGRVEIHRLDNVESVPWIGALRAAQNLGLTGKGVKIGIIDTGIDYLHANFRSGGIPGDYAGNDKAVIEPGTFPTAKVAGGWDFAGAIYDARTDADPANDLPAPDPDPLDGNGHGSHVSGSAAGLGVPGSIGAGVAPDAHLYALKVFNDTSGSTDLTSDAIEWAMDPNGDGSMKDHLDVINMSLGSPFGEPADPSAISSNNATRVGIIVVASAGNSGNVPYVTGAPGVAARAISVAATTPGGRLYSRVNVTAPADVAGLKTNFEGTGPVQLKDTGPISAGVVEAVPLNGCTALSNAAEMVGKIALIQRGTCAFATKYAAAAAAGAKAILVFNNAPGAPIVMGGLGSATIPGVMISLDDGTAVNVFATTAADSPVNVTLDVAPDASRDDQAATFTSRGPSSDQRSGFKPNLAAPGVAIVSTGVGTGTGSLTLQGTSMAAPHVAGAAALLRQEHPGLRPGAIGALLQNSTVDGNSSSDTGLARLGVGVVRVDEAALLSSYASPGGISFGRINPRYLVDRTEKVALTNMSRNRRTFWVTHVPQATYPGVTVSCPNSVSVNRYGSRDFNIQLRFDPAASAAAGAFDQASVSQTEVDGWCVLNDGTDSLRVGYLAVVDAASGMRVMSSHYPSMGDIDIRNNGPAVGFAEGFTLARSDREWSTDKYGSCDKYQHGDRGKDDSGNAKYSSRGDGDAGDHDNGDNGGGSNDDDDDSCLIGRLGVRAGDPNNYFGFSVVEFGVALNKTYQHISNLTIELFLDVDKDGVDDVDLVAADWSSLSATGTLGTYVTAQFVSGNGGFLDWIVGGWDFNDRVAILPFTTEADGGLVPSSFNYRLVVTNRQGAVDTQTGSINLADEIKPDLNSFGLGRGDSAHITVSGGEGKMLWLFPNNTDRRQDDTVYAAPGQ